MDKKLCPHCRGWKFLSTYSYGIKTVICKLCEGEGYLPDVEAWRPADLAQK